MTWKYFVAGALLATTALAAAPTASAAILKGYTDLYATDMRTGYQQSGGDTQSNYFAPCAPAGAGPCAKTRFSFSYDTTKPFHQMRTSLQLIESYYVPTPENPDPYFPSKVIDGKEYLPLPFYSYVYEQIAASYPQLEPTFPPGDFTAPPDYLPADQVTSSYHLIRFAVGPPGNLFSLGFGANRLTHWVQFECSADADYYQECRDLQGQHPAEEGTTGPFFAGTNILDAVQDLSISSSGGYLDSRHGDSYWDVRLGGIGSLSYVTYAFDNDPANWLDGPPRSRIWIVAAPEPASLSLLAVGLLALAGAARGARRRD